ncbi:hypothetical protein [Dyella silvae]|uniref:hypothetical protein n=1 Tax=Dyella silvae TaxID=2994424 RepID=UPI002264E2C7|nr:hypothetical protein [Dyella silvae]
MNVLQLIAIALGLVASNAAVFMFVLNPWMTNGFFFGGLFFILLAQLPRSLIGFAITAGEWGDKWREWLGPNEAIVTNSRDRRLAAHRSIAVLSLFLLFGLLSMWVRSPETEHAMQTDLSCLLGMWLGFLSGYLVIIGRREASQ